MSQIEITEPVPILDEFGRPQNFGWARSPNFIYNPALINAPSRRISEGDRYILASSKHLIVFEALDDGYLGYLLVSVCPLGGKKSFAQTMMTPFSLGSFGLSNDGDSGSIKFVHKKAMLNFANMDGGVRLIKTDIPKFNQNHSLMGQLVLTPPEGAESLFTNMPWRGDGKAFFCLRRSPWYSAEGVIQFGINEMVFTREDGWGIYEWSRGVRPRSDLRFWASGCGQIEGRQAGFSIGYNSADSTMGTENAFFLDGKIHKLDQVSFHIPSGRLVPWRFTSNDKRLEMNFTPKQERDENHQMMFLYSLRRRQFFGTFSGKVKLDDGSEIGFQNIPGMAERRKSRL